LFATWLLPVLEDGYLDGMHASVGVRVPFRYALVNGWYYNATPVPSPRLLARVLWRGRRRAVKVLYHALFRVGRDPAAADRAVLSGLAHDWRQVRAPRYRQLVAGADAEVESASPRRLVELVDQLGREAGIALWYLAIVGGSAWKMEAALTRFARRYLADVLPDHDGGAQVLLRGLSGAQPTFGAHAVHSVDWYHPLAADLPAPPSPAASAAGRNAALAAQRVAAEQRCHAALADRSPVRHRFERLLAVNQRYAVIREQQASELTLAWPVLRACATRIGRDLAGRGMIERAEDVYFCTRDEVTAALDGRSRDPLAGAARRREVWQRQRRLAAPLALGRPARLIGDVIERAVRQARGAAEIAEGAVVGHPASAGRATGQVRVVHSPEDFAAFRVGEVLVARATAPAWTPLFARAAAVVTDGGTLAAHASLVAREFGIPAVVGTGDATRRLRDGQLVTVDGTAGMVMPHVAPETEG
jgi:pyruvate,water dikinase